MRHPHPLPILCASLLVACGGSSPEPVAPSAEEQPQTSASAPEPEPDDESEDEGTEDEGDEDESPSDAKTPPPAPDFPPNATVEEAIAAVPQGSERLNLDHETLAKPLQDPDLYAPCKAGSQHFTLKIAVWDGRAVGVDVVTKNAKLKECLTSRIRELEWDDKVPSLNTIEYGF